MNKKISTAAIGALLAVFAASPAAAQIPETVAPVAPGSVKAQAKETKQMREQFRKEAAEYRQARREWKKAQQMRQKWQQADPAERKKMKEKSGVILTGAIDRMIERLRRIKTWVGNRGALSAADKAKITAEIDRDIAWLERKKGKVADASPAEVKEHLREIRSYWRENRKSVKKYAGIVLAARADKAIARGDKISELIHRKIAALKAAGKDTARAEKLSADFDAKLALAKEKLSAARAAFTRAQSEKEADALLKEGREFMTRARQYLRQARQIGREIVRELRNS